MGWLRTRMAPGGRRSRTVEALAAATAIASPAVASSVVAMPVLCERLEERRLMAGDPIINEFVTKNDDGLTIANGSRPDWIEIYNPGTTAVNLAGWTIHQTDVAGVAAQYTIPATNATATTVNAGAYKLIYADSEPGIRANNEIHTNFNLDRAGGSLVLRKPDSTVTSEFLAYPEFPADDSYGNGVGGLQFFLTPTPGAANIGGVNGYVKDTKFSVDRGFFTAAFPVTITSATAGASIRYTLDGTPPTATTGTLYTAPISVTGTTTLRAAAFLTNYAPSNVDTQTYLFPADVQNQTVPSAKYPSASYPAAWKGATLPGDYNVDYADVSGSYAADFHAGLIDPNVPSISIVTAPANFFNSSTGIYMNPTSEGVAWERPVSIELINPNGAEGFQIDAGLRIHGGASRQPNNQPKHSLRALFKTEYGAGKLEFPLFGPGTGSLDSIVFRSTYNNGWTQNNAAQRLGAEYIRDGWNRVTQGEMGQPAIRQKFTHVYINGLYWGLYDITDRPSDQWAVTVLGGEREHYEVINSGEGVSGPPSTGDPEGTTRARNDYLAMFTALNGNMADPAVYANVVANWVDPDNLADYIIQNYYGANQDWDHHNFYAYRNTVSTTDRGWKWVTWDSERTLEDVNSNITSKNTDNGPTRVFTRMMLNPDFRILFADRVHKALFNDGALTPAKARARYLEMANQIQYAIVDEAARWADHRVDGVYGKNTWQAEVNRLTATTNLTGQNAYFMRRTDIVIGQFRNAGFYPAATASAPVYSQFGGQVPANYVLSIANPGNQAGSTVYYTLDGTDPRVGPTSTTLGGAVSGTALTYNASNKPVLTAGTRVLARVRLSTGIWSALTDATFQVAGGPALRISELMYHSQDDPAGLHSDQDLDYIELVNTGADPLDLAGYVIGSGVTYTFPSGLPPLGPGERIVVPDKVASFAYRYGPPAGVRVTATPYSGDLSNSGETITLTGPLGEALQSITYTDAWYPATDGDGYSLVAVDPKATNAVLSSAAGWTQSLTLNGTPGVAFASVVGDGTSQRSMVKQFTLDFDRAVVSWDASAFSLTRQDPDGGSPVGVSVVANLAADARRIVLTFTGGGIVGGSLADGMYDLVVRPSFVQHAAGVAAGGADRTTNARRLFGDADGDGDVDGTDSRGFRTALGAEPGSPLYNPVFDFDSDGDVDGSDSREFRTRLGT